MQIEMEAQQIGDTIVALDIQIQEYEKLVVSLKTAQGILIARAVETAAAEANAARAAEGM